jgi:hypothetical protein
MFPIKYLQKAFQRWLQPVLMEVISIDQSTFFLLHHSLDGILLVHETLEWAKTSNQNLILDFSKAFDKVFWAFLYQCLELSKDPNLHLNLKTFKRHGTCNSKVIGAWFMFMNYSKDKRHFMYNYFMAHLSITLPLTRPFRLRVVALIYSYTHLLLGRICWVINCFS